ncbi:MAG: DUF6624 domain-containing protein, partial [Cystobacter sp.]
AARGDVPLRHVAYLTDVVRLRAGREQLFGTKFRELDGELVPHPIEKEAEVDARRQRAGLEPLAAYARRLRRTFSPRRTKARMTDGIDWASFARHHWEKAPGVLSPEAPIVPGERVFRTLVEASAPFRFGTRFRALPNVKFLTGNAQLRAPGTLLPGPGDDDVGSYLRRVADKVGGRRSQLLVEQPFLLDFFLWDRLRGFLQGLFERVGLPVLPVSTEVFVGDFARAPRGVEARPHHSLFLLVLQGRLRIRVSTSPATVLEAREGQVLYVPSRAEYVEECRGRCMALRLWIPMAGAPPVEEVRELLVTLLDEQMSPEGPVPLLPYPWRRGRQGTGAPIASLSRVARGLEALIQGPDLEQALRILWAQRVSAGGLEPVPPPLDVPPLEDATLVRGVPHVRVVRMEDSPGQWIWAIHGHAFPMQESPESSQILDVLRSGEAVRVSELCRVARRASQRAMIRQLLETLHALRALEVVAGRED